MVRFVPAYCRGACPGVWGHREPRWCRPPAPASCWTRWSCSAGPQTHAGLGPAPFWTLPLLVGHNQTQGNLESEVLVKKKSGVTYWTLTCLKFGAPSRLSGRQWIFSKWSTLGLYSVKSRPESFEIRKISPQETTRLILHAGSRGCSSPSSGFSRSGSSAVTAVSLLISSDIAWIRAWDRLTQSEAWGLVSSMRSPSNLNVSHVTCTSLLSKQFFCCIVHFSQSALSLNRRYHISYIKILLGMKVHISLSRNFFHLWTSFDFWTGKKPV